MSNPVSATASGAAAATPSATPVAASGDGNVAAKAKAQYNAAVVQASLTVSLNTSNDPLALVLKTALTGINEALQGQYGDNAIQNAASQDNTPEGTASRIVALSTGFYDAYKRQNPGQDEDTVLQNFIGTLQRGVEQGFKEARGILDGLKVLNGEVASNIDKTYTLVQQGLADFAASRKSAPAPAAAAA
ncbi:MAG: DUF5610 domain-containing protein [Sphingomonadaceae bacterium]